MAYIQYIYHGGDSKFQITISIFSVMEMFVKKILIKYKHLEKNREFENKINQEVSLVTECSKIQFRQLKLLFNTSSTLGVNKKILKTIFLLK